ncbi:MAG: hypothetical protein RML72_00255 [Bacteroidia bacterium]|nr:hypothetical protein [Bacteroidia bacterium]MDW8157300.1 hypothetical protein [Bacteroidia bacterium]
MQIQKKLTLTICLDLKEGSLEAVHSSQDKVEEVLLRLFAAAQLLDDLSGMWLKESSQPRVDQDNLQDLETCQHFLEVYSQTLLEQLQLMMK